MILLAEDAVECIRGSSEKAKRESDQAVLLRSCAVKAEMGRREEADIEVRRGWSHIASTATDQAMFDRSRVCNYEVWSGEGRNPAASAKTSR